MASCLSFRLHPHTLSHLPRPLLPPTLLSPSAVIPVVGPHRASWHDFPSVFFPLTFVRFSPCWEKTPAAELICVGFGSRFQTAAENIAAASFTQGGACLRHHRAGFPPALTLSINNCKQKSRTHVTLFQFFLLVLRNSNMTDVTDHFHGFW